MYGNIFLGFWELGGGHLWGSHYPAYHRHTCFWKACSCLPICLCSHTHLTVCVGTNDWMLFSLLGTTFASSWWSPKAVSGYTFLGIWKHLAWDMARGTQPSGIHAFPSFPPIDALARLLFLPCNCRQNPMGNKHKLFYCNGISLKEMLYSTVQYNCLRWWNWSISALNYCSH